MIYIKNIQITFQRNLEKNFTEVSKNLARYRSENNFVELSK